MSVARIGIGFVFFWAFLDKLFALGLHTGKDGETGTVDYFGPAAWISGGHPTEGFLKSAAGEFGGEPGGVYGGLFKGWGGFSIGAKLGAWSAVGPLVMMFIAGFDNSNNPLIDDHIVYSLAGVGIVYTELKYQAIGLGGWWRKVPLVQKYSWLV